MNNPNLPPVKPSSTAEEAFQAGHVLYEQEGAVATLTFNRPEVRNALTFGMYEALYETCEKVDRDETIRVLVLKGGGEKAFVAGTDISQFKAFNNPAEVKTYEDQMDRVFGRYEQMQKPVIALLRGYTVGGGLAIAIGADLRIATPELQFGLPIARTLGNFVGMRSLSRLMDLIGIPRTKDLIYTARMMGAEEAFTCGLVKEIVPGSEIEGRVREVARTIAGNAPLTIQATKEAVRRIARHRVPAAADDLATNCYLSQDFREGVDAFLNKRRPNWQGR